MAWTDPPGIQIALRGGTIRDIASNDANIALQHINAIDQAIAPGIDLAHPRIQQRKDALGTCQRSNGFKTGHRNQRQIGGYRHPLRATASHAQAGEGAGTDAKGNRIQLADLQSGFGQQFTHQRQQGFRVRTSRRTGALKHLPITPKRTGA